MATLLALIGMVVNEVSYEQMLNDGLIEKTRTFQISKTKRAIYKKSYIEWTKRAIRDLLNKKSYKGLFTKRVIKG